MDQRKTIVEMVSEFLREAAVLVLVFGFLDVFVTGKPFSAVWTGFVLLVSALALTMGILLERERKVG
jgi:hypothetical protein